MGLDVGDDITTVGGVKSAVMVIVSVDELLAASLAVTIMTLLPLCNEMLADQFVVPVAVPLLGEQVEHVQVTDVTPTLSDAVPDTVIGVVPVV